VNNDAQFHAAQLHAEMMEKLDRIESKIDRLLMEIMIDPDLKPYRSAKQRARLKSELMQRERTRKQ